MPRPSGFLVWFHAASVGETNAVLPVIEAIAARASGDQPAAHHRHGHLGEACAGAAAEGRRASICAARQSGLCAAVPRPLAAGPRGVRRIGDLAEPRAGDEGAQRAARAGQRPHVVPLLPPLAQPPRLEPSAVLRLRPGARPERALRPALHRARRAARRRVGNLKADAPPPPVDLASTGNSRAALAGRTVWLAASTHPGEDDMVAVAHLAMKGARPRSPHHHRAAASGPRPVHREAAERARISMWRSARRASCPTRAPTSISPTRSASLGCSTISCRSPLSAARSCRMAGRTRSRRSSSAPPCSPARIGGTSPTPMRSC